MKTIITKKIIALIGLIILFTNISAQNDVGRKRECDAYMKPSRYVFEGKIISSKYGIRVKTGEYTYYNFNSYLVQVQKVIKGNIQKGTIEIVEWAPGITYIKDGYMEGSQPPTDDMDKIPSEGIYFSKTGPKADIKDSSVVNTNSKSLQYWGAIPLSNGELVKQPRGGIADYFSTLTEFYDYISTNYGVKIDSGK